MRYIKSGSLVTALATSLFVVACGGGSGGGDGGSFSSAPLQTNTNIQIVEVASVSGKNDEFRANMRSVALEPLLMLNQVSNVFNNRTIDTIYMECFRNGAPHVSPHYDSSVDTAFLCDQFVDLALETFVLGGNSAEGAYIATLAAMNFTMFHELGHGIISENQYAVGGNPESVVDAMAVVLSKLTGQRYSAYAAADLFSLLSQRESGSTFFGEHPASEDRAGDITCWWLGASANDSVIATRWPMLLRPVAGIVPVNMLFRKRSYLISSRS